jgi:hypothetical protein
MPITLIEKQIEKSELAKIAQERFGDLVKAVVDVQRSINPTCPLTSLIRELRRTICFASVVAKVVTLASSRISHFVHLAYAAKGG